MWRKDEILPIIPLGGLYNEKEERNTLRQPRILTARHYMKQLKLFL